MAPREEIPEHDRRIAERIFMKILIDALEEVLQRQQEQAVAVELPQAVERIG